MFENQLLTPISETATHYVEVTLGAPSRDCRGFGICRLEFLDPESYENLRLTQKTKPHGAFGTLTVLTPSTLRLRLDRWSMTRATYWRHFATGRFRMCEPISLMSPENQILEIQSGWHSMTVSDSLVDISLLLTPNHNSNITTYFTI